MVQKKTTKSADSVEIEFRGVHVNVPTGDNIPSDAAVAFDEGKGLKFLQLLVGAEQWRQVVAVAPTVGDLKEFGDKLYEAMDTTSGE